MVGRDGGQAAPSTRHGDEVTTPRGSSGPRDPERRKGDLQGPPRPAPPPAQRRPWQPTLPAEPRGAARRGRAGAKPLIRGAGPRGHTPAWGAAEPWARQFRGAAGPSPTAQQSRGGAGHSDPQPCPRPPGGTRHPCPRAGPRGVSRVGSGARGGGAGGAVGGGAGGGRGRARGPTCPGRASQWASGVRKDRHIWTCSGAARAAGPRARPASLKYRRGRPRSVSLAAAGPRIAFSRRSSFASTTAASTGKRPVCAPRALVLQPGAAVRTTPPARGTRPHGPGIGGAGPRRGGRPVHGGCGVGGGGIWVGGPPGAGPGRSAESPGGGAAAREWGAS